MKRVSLHIRYPKIIPRPSLFLFHFLFFTFFILHSSFFISYSQDRPNPGVIPLQLGRPPVSDDQLAMQFFQSRDFEKAAELYGNLYEKNPTPYFYTYYFFCLVEIHDYDKARRLIREQQKKEGESARLQVDLGYLNYREGNPDKAKRIFEEAIRKLTPNQQQIFDLANAFVARNENEYAIRTYLYGRELLKNSYPFGFELASVYERTGDIAGTVDAYLDLIAYNPSYQKTIQDRLQNFLAAADDDERSEILRKKILARVQKDPEMTPYTELLWWFSVQEKDFSLALVQAKALDTRLREGGQRILSLCLLAESNGDYRTAFEGYGYLVKKGPSCPAYETARMEEVNARYRITIDDPGRTAKMISELEILMREELKRCLDEPRCQSLMKNLAHLEAFYMGKTDEAVGILEKAIVLEGTTLADRSECKIELADILLFKGDVWEATLLYQQVYQDFKNDVLGQTAKFRNTKLDFYIGEYDWAKAQADILKAATSKLIANDAMVLSLMISENYDPDSGRIALAAYSRADLLAFQNRDDEAMQTLDSILLMYTDHPILDNVLFRKAEIMAKNGKLIEADSLYRQVTDLFPEDVLADLALFRRAEIHDRKLNNREKAMSLYAELIEKYPDCVFIPDARKRYRQLRGDNVK